MIWQCHQRIQVFQDHQKPLAIRESNLWKVSYSLAQPTLLRDLYLQALSKEVFIVAPSNCQNTRNRRLLKASLQKEQMSISRPYFLATRFIQLWAPLAVIL
jgi:hypothetical protein